MFTLVFVCSLENVFTGYLSFHGCLKVLIDTYGRCLFTSKIPIKIQWNTAQNFFISTKKNHESIVFLSFLVQYLTFFSQIFNIISNHFLHFFSKISMMVLKGWQKRSIIFSFVPQTYKVVSHFLLYYSFFHFLKGINTEML